MREIEVINFEDYDLDKVYRNYACAMGKRRKGSELPFENFAAYICREDVFCYQYGSSYIFGVKENGIFIPTHFAPAGLKESIDQIKSMLSYDNVVFVITADLSSMLKRLGFIILPFKVVKDFHGEKVLKTIAVSSLRGFISIFLKNKYISVKSSISCVLQKLLHKVYCATNKKTVQKNMDALYN
jgi:hypothetical protein